MSLSKELREKIQFDILKHIEIINELDVDTVAKKHKVSRQTVYRYLQDFQKRKIIEELGTGTNKRKQYTVAIQKQKNSYIINNGLSEENIWRRDIKPFCLSIPQNAYEKVQYIFLEIMNNAIEHSEGEIINVVISKSPVRFKMTIEDDGIGIFQKIQTVFDLPEKSFAILELAKGKLTTDQDTHTGEGIFFSSRIADNFDIISQELIFTSKFSKNQNMEARLFQNEQPVSRGTLIVAVIYFDNDTSINEVVNMFTEHPEHIGFNATHVPVRLLEYGSENPILVSRSEARRLLSRFERFSRITLDFEGVEDIRQGFADEVFRVFPNKHPDCMLEVINCNEKVQAMIAHVKNTK